MTGSYNGEESFQMPSLRTKHWEILRFQLLYIRRGILGVGAILQGLVGVADMVACSDF